MGGSRVTAADVWKLKVRDAKLQLLVQRARLGTAYSAKEIARFTGFSTTTVERIERRAIRKLRIQLRKISVTGTSKTKEL